MPQRASQPSPQRASQPSPQRASQPSTAARPAPSHRPRPAPSAAPRPTRAARPGKPKVPAVQLDENTERLVTAWQGEAEATPERPDKALILYEIGCAREQAGDPEGAIAAWEEARTLDPNLRAALDAAIRVRGRNLDADSAQALSELFAIEARVKSSPAEESSALLDQGAILEDFLGRGKQARPLYERALKATPQSTAAALALELHLRRNGEPDAALHASAARAPHIADPVLKRLLFAEAALARESDGEVDEAIEFLRTATKEPLERFRLLETLEGIARRHGKEEALREVLARMAELAEARSRGDNIGQGLTAGALPPFANERDARARAAGLWQELARRRLDAGLPTEALEASERARALQADDLFLQNERMILAERTGDIAAAREAAETLAKSLTGAQAAAVLLHLADLARAAGDAAAEERALEQAAERGPQSPAVAGIVQERLLRAKAPVERIAWLERRASRKDGGPPLGLWHAAAIAADELADARRAQNIFQRALERVPSEHTEGVLRDMLGAGLRLGADEMVITAARALVDTTGDERERAHLLFELYRRSHAGEGAEARQIAVRRLTDDPAVGPWAADVARVEAAFRKDFDLLAEAHRSLASRATEPDTVAAHLCGAARALVRADKVDDALEPLEEARARVPAHPYALALLEDVLRARGDEAAVADLLAESATGIASGRDAEPLILRAAALAEAAGDTERAADFLRTAIERNPKSMAPVERLAHLAIVRKDATLEREALEVLAASELASGRPGLAQLRLATRLLLDRSEPERALAALRECFPDDTVGAYAAVMLLVSPDHAEHEHEAIDRLLRDARGHGAAGLRRRAGGLLLAHGDARGVKPLLPRIREARKDDRWVAWTEIEIAEDAAARSAALESLATSTSDATLAAELLVQARVLTAIAGGPSAPAREAALTAAIVERAGASAFGAILADEPWLAEVDPKDRLERLEARARHASPEQRPQLLSVLGRAHVAAGRYAEAVPALREALAKDHDDLASWEALAIAAREAEAWTELIQACDRLADLATGAPRARLLEEAAVAMSDHLGRQIDAEPRLREALVHDPASAIAFRRLHTLLDERKDTAGLLALIGARIANVEDPAERIALFDEQARLRHDLGDLDGTLESLRALQALDPGNAGALALMAETSARLERWSDAVEALRSLSCVDVPADERQKARLAASRYARERLGDLEGALADLRVIEGMGLADEALELQTAALAEAAGRHRDAAEALVRAAAITTDRHDKARYERRAAELFVDPVLDADAAVDAYLRAIEAAPHDLASAEGLAALVDGEERREVAEAFQAAIRSRLETHPTDAGAIRKLRRSATWCGQRDLETRALDVLVALGQASAGERADWEALRARAPVEMRGSLAPADLAPDGWDKAIRGVVAAADDAIASMDGIEPGALGAGRRSLVKDKEDNPVRDAVSAIAASLGTGCDRFFVVDSASSRIEAVPQGTNPPAWVVSDEVQAPLSAEDRFRAALLAAGAGTGTACLLRRGRRDAEALVHAIAQVSDTTLGDAPAEAASLAGPVKKALGRKARKAVADAARYAAPDAALVEAFVHAAHVAVHRTALLVGGELAAVFERLPEERKPDLVRWWLSDEAEERRRAIGLAFPDDTVGDVDTSEATAERSPVPVVHQTTVEQLLESVIAAHPFTPKGRTAGGLVLVDAAASLRERVTLLLQLAAQREGKTRARLLLAAAELLETMGEMAEHDRLVQDALGENPNALMALRRVRALRAREGNWREVGMLLEREAAMPVTPEERALLLLLASFVARHALDDAAAAENAAKRSFMIRPQSAATAIWLARAQRDSGHAADAAATAERAASLTSDAALGATWLVAAANEAELAGDAERARRFYRQALRLDGDALDAAIGLARRAWADGDAREASQAAQAAAGLVTDTLLRDAFLVAASRLTHALSEQPAEAVRILAGAEDPVAAFARVDAARGQRDKRVLAEALRAAANASRRTERAVALVELAEVRAESGDLDGAFEALREAGQADQTLTTLRVVREELARRTGDAGKVARATRGAGHGALAAAAHAAKGGASLEAERALLREAGRSDPTAAVVGLDAAAEAGDRRSASQLMESQPSGVGASLALADLYLAEDRADDAIVVLQKAHEGAPEHPVVRRWLATLLPPGEGAALWLADAEVAGDSAAFAATMAGKLYAAAGKLAEASAAQRRALELAPGHPPITWALESLARASAASAEGVTRTETAALRESMTRGAEDSADPRAAAEVLVRSAFLGGELDPTLLARAYDVAPDDPVLADLRLRTGDLAPLARAELLARQAGEAEPRWARALLLRAAFACERAQEWSEAAVHARAARAASGGDAFAERLLDRVEPLAGELDAAAERLVEATAEAPDDVSRALAFERYASFEAFVRNDLETAANPLYGLLEQYPAHAASLRMLERIFMTVEDDVRLKEIEERIASLGNPRDAIAHARLATRLARRLPGASGEAADDVLRAAFDYVTVDPWLLREVEGMARHAGDARVLVQVLEEQVDRADEGPARVAAEMRLAEAVAKARSPAAAVTRLSRLARDEVGHPLLAEAIARLQEAAGDAAEAAEAYETAARAARSDARAKLLFYGAGRLWDERVGDLRRAADAFSEVARRELAYADVFDRLRRLLPSIGESARLADLVEIAIEHTRGDKARLVELHLLLAQLTQEVGDLAAAKKSLRTVATMEPKRADVLEQLARVCAAEEDWRGAIDALQRITRAVEDPAELYPVLLELGDLYQRTRNVPRAAAAYKQALDLFPDDPAATARLESIRAPK